MPQSSSVPRLLAAVVCGAVLLLPASASAQTDAAELPPLVESIDVEVVNVDVVVTDRAGRPITGLTADDFVLLEDGVERPISNFFSFRQGELLLAGEERAAEAGEATWPESRMLRRMAILFDNNSLEKRDRQRIIEQLERFVLEQFDGSYEWAVIAYADELQLMEPFTSDKTRVLGALSRVDDLPIPVRRRHASDATILEEMPVVTGDPRRNRRTIDQVVLGLTQRDFEMRERMLQGLLTFDLTAAAILQTMRAHMGLEGRKSLVLVTGALETLPGGSQAIGRGFPALGGDDRADPMIASMYSDLLQRFDAIIKMANASGFSIYPISADALMKAHSSYIDVDRNASLSLAGGGDVPADLDVETASRTMADGTGGRFYSTTRFYDAVDDIDDLTANSYVLGFATNHAPEGRYHRVEVKPKRDGLRIQHRQGYIHLTRGQQIAEQLATPLAFPKEQGDFGVHMEIFPPERESKKKVSVIVAGVIPLRNVTLIPQGEDMIGRVHLYLAIYDPEGNLVDLIREAQDVRVAAAKVADAEDDAPARFGLRLKNLPQGEYTITLTLIDEVTKRYGTGLTPVRL